MSISVLTNSSRIRLGENILNGMIAESIAINDFIKNGFGIKRTGYTDDLSINA